MKGAAAPTSIVSEALLVPALKPPAKKLLPPPIRWLSLNSGNVKKSGAPPPPYGATVNVLVVVQSGIGTVVSPLCDGCPASPPGFRMRFPCETAGSAASAAAATATASTP